MKCNPPRGVISATRTDPLDRKQRRRRRWQKHGWRALLTYSAALPCVSQLVSQQNARPFIIRHRLIRSTTRTYSKLCRSADILGERCYLTFASRHEPPACRLSFVTFVRPAQSVERRRKNTLLKRSVSVATLLGPSTGSKRTSWRKLY